MMHRLTPGRFGGSYSSQGNLERQIFHSYTCWNSSIFVLRGSADLLLPLVLLQLRLQGSQPLHLQLLRVDPTLRHFKLSPQTLHLQVACPALLLLLLQ